MNLCCICDDNYVLPLRVMLKSLSRYETSVSFWLVYSDVNEANLRAISHDMQFYGWSFHAMKVDDGTLQLSDSLPKLHYFSKEVYYRLFIPWILMDCDRVLYIDCDTLVCGSLSELYASEMNDAAIAAVPDGEASKELYESARLGLTTGRYYNSGVLLIDCEAIRGGVTQAGMRSLIEEAAALNDLFYPDQDLMNLIYQGKILALDKIWNFTVNFKSGSLRVTPSSEIRAIKVKHYIGPVKPWHPEFSSFSLDYWIHLRQFLSVEDRCMFWKRKKPVRLVRAKLNRIAERIKRTK